MMMGNLVLKWRKVKTEKIIKSQKLNFSSIILKVKTKALFQNCFVNCLFIILNHLRYEKFNFSQTC